MCSQALYPVANCSLFVQLYSSFKCALGQFRGWEANMRQPADPGDYGGVDTGRKGKLCLTRSCSSA